MSTGFVKLQRGEMVEWLLTHDIKAFALLARIALRARFSSNPGPMGLAYGQALIGDWKSCSLTQKEYRCAKARLAAHGLVGFKGRAKGTVATLLDSRVFSLRDERQGGSGHFEGEPKGGQVSVVEPGLRAPTRAKKGHREGGHRAINKIEKNGQNVGENAPTTFVPLSLSPEDCRRLADIFRMPESAVHEVMAEFNRIKSAYPDDPRTVEAFQTWMETREVGKNAVKRVRAASRAISQVLEPEGWQEWLSGNRPNCDYTGRQWVQLSPVEQKGILDQMAL